MGCPLEETQPSGTIVTEGARKSVALRIVRILLLCIVLYSAIGVVMFPDWWFTLVFEGGYADPSTWVVGNLYGLYVALGILFPPILTIWGVLSFSTPTAHDRVRAFNHVVLARSSQGIGFWATLVVLLLAFLTGLHYSGPRTEPFRKSMAQLKESQKHLDEVLQKNKVNDDPPLSEPTAFAYIDTAEVESLYGQNEPELVPTLVRQKIEKIAKGDASISVEDYLKSSVGVSQERTQEEELRRTEKNPQRKLKDLIDFLYSQQKLKRYGHQQWKSDELQKLEDATSLLSRYGVLADPAKLRAVRDRILSEEVQRLDNELSTLHGLVLVEGDWLITRTPTGYRLTAPVVEQISNPPSFEFRLNDGDLQSKTKDVIESQKARPIRLTAFGNVIAGATGLDHNVQFVPIAVF